MEQDALVRASDLSGRAVVDMDAAEKVGSIDRIVLDTVAQQVAGFLVSRGGKLAGDGMFMTVPAAAIHAIGPDAVTFHRPASIDEATFQRFDALPRASDLIGRKVVSEDGRVLGTIDDVLIDRTNFRILGYSVSDRHVLAKLEGLLGGDRKKRGITFLRPDVEIRPGQELIIAPASALVEAATPDDLDRDNTGAAQAYQGHVVRASHDAGAPRPGDGAASPTRATAPRTAVPIRRDESSPSSPGLRQGPENDPFFP